jgi:hypothetical protein
METRLTEYRYYHAIVEAKSDAGGQAVFAAREAFLKEWQQGKDNIELFSKQTLKQLNEETKLEAKYLPEIFHKLGLEAKYGDDATLPATASVNAQAGAKELSNEDEDDDVILGEDKVVG